jgi:hypothetical protein
MSAADRAARRREQRGRNRSPILPGIGPMPIRISQAPKTQAERDALMRQCLQAAKRSGKRGVHARIQATRYYNDAITESNRAVREPATQPSVLTRPGPTVPTPSAPRGMQQTASGLYVPQPPPDSQESR